MDFSQIPTTAELTWFRNEKDGEKYTFLSALPKLGRILGSSSMGESCGSLSQPAPCWPHHTLILMNQLHQFKHQTD